MLLESTIPLRIWRNYRALPNGCWEWQGYTQNGYGAARFGGRRGRLVGLHRLMYETFKGTIPAGFFVCHRCDNKVCGNPLHLFAGTHQDNMIDASNKGRLGHRRDVCKRGHPMVPGNYFEHLSIRGNVDRKCRLCSNLTRRLRRAVAGR